MQIRVPRKILADDFARVSAVVPARSPKPVLQNVLLRADADGASLAATDLEVSVRVRVLGVEADGPGAALLGPRVGQVLATAPEGEVSLRHADDDPFQLVVSGDRFRFALMTDDPDLFPEPPTFDAPGWFALDPAELRRTIRRTIFATDQESTRYALGGVLFGPTADGLTLVATDGRRLAKVELPAGLDSPAVPAQAPVVPVKALKLVDRLMGKGEDDGVVRLAFTATGATFATASTTIYTRLVEGRFPRYQDAIPRPTGAPIRTTAGALRSAVQQAMVTTSDQSRGVDFAIAPGKAVLSATAFDAGRSTIEMALAYAGPELVVTFDPRYLLDFLKVLGDDDEIAFEASEKQGSPFTAADGYLCVVMPLSRAR